MKHGKALMLALATAVVTACASAGGGATAEVEAEGNRPRETEATRQAGVHLVQAGLAEGEEAQAQYQEALTDALMAIEQMPLNPKGYLVAGQAAVGLEEYVQADTLFDRALELWPEYGAQIEAEREQGWVTAYNLGAEALNAGDIELALARFSDADAIYQGRPEARIALGSLYAQQGDTEAAANAYVSALEILMQDPPEGLSEEQVTSWQESRQAAALNAADLLARAGQFDRAAEVLESYLAEYESHLDAATARRARTALAGFYAQSGDRERAEAMYAEIMGREDLSSADYFQAGIGFFNTGDYAQAAEAFGNAAEMNPYNRDALLNLVQSLYSYAQELEQAGDPPADTLREIYQGVLDNAEAVRELDPLNRNLASFQLRSFRSLADLGSGEEAAAYNRQAQQLFSRYQSQRFEVSEIQLSMQGESEAQVTGVLTNHNADAGAQVELRFEVLDQTGAVIDTEVLELTAPEQGAAVRFNGSLEIAGGQFAGWRYSVDG